MYMGFWWRRERETDALLGCPQQGILGLGLRTWPLFILLPQFNISVSGNLFQRNDSRRKTVFTFNKLGAVHGGEKGGAALTSPGERAGSVGQQGADCLQLLPLWALRHRLPLALYLLGNKKGLLRKWL